MSPIFINSVGTLQCEAVVGLYVYAACTFHTWLFNYWKKLKQVHTANSINRFKSHFEYFFWSSANWTVFNLLSFHFASVKRTDKFVILSNNKVRQIKCHREFMDDKSSFSPIKQSTTSSQSKMASNRLQNKNVVASKWFLGKQLIQE